MGGMVEVTRLLEKEGEMKKMEARDGGTGGMDEVRRLLEREREMGMGMGMGRKC